MNGWRCTAGLTRPGNSVAEAGVLVRSLATAMDNKRSIQGWGGSLEGETAGVREGLQQEKDRRLMAASSWASDFVGKTVGERKVLACHFYS